MTDRVDADAEVRIVQKIERYAEVDHVLTRCAIVERCGSDGRGVRAWYTAQAHDWTHR
jgi:hypothetical protein